MDKLRLIAILTLHVVLSGLPFTQEQTRPKTKGQEWILLFIGKDLTGWQQLNGRATYNVENGEIVGTTIANSPNSFLCTKRTVSDFILEFEIMVDPDINSGVQFRSFWIYF